MDFTLKVYRKLLAALLKEGYRFLTFEKFIESKSESKTIVLRHDVDRLPLNALRMAQIEHAHGVGATYYFRIADHVWDEKTIKKIVLFGHEVAYHYEDLSIFNGDFDKAIQHFENQLARFRMFYPVKTICMHGSPLSKWDNRELWKKYDYRDYGIIAEPYLDVNYSEVFYITDTGRGWNRNNVNVRDVVNSNLNININNTQHLVDLISSDKVPDILIINIHPHRWFNPGLGWMNEFLIQNVKNVFKSILIWFR